MGCAGPHFRLAPRPPRWAEDFSFQGGLLVASQSQKTVSMYSVDFLTSALTGPVFTITTRYTPVAVAVLQGFFYLANAEGGISAYQIVNGTGATEIAGSPFASGSGPVALVGGLEPPVLYVANSRSNNISGYSVNGNTGALTPLNGSPYTTGQGPASIILTPAPVLNIFGARLVMVANKLSNNVTVFSVAGDGSLSPVPGSPFAVDGVALLRRRHDNWNAHDVRVCDHPGAERNRGFQH